MQGGGKPNGFGAGGFKDEDEVERMGLLLCNVSTLFSACLRGVGELDVPSMTVDWSDIESNDDARSEG